MSLQWPNGKKVAVAVTVMYETWSEGKAPSYSVQATPLKPGATDLAGAKWSTYGGRVGVWRIIRSLDRLGIPGTFFTNAACADLYPDSIRQIVASGHDIGGHAWYQNELLAYKEPKEERETIFRSLDKLEEISGTRPTGWLSPVLAFTPHTPDFLREAGCTWHADVTYTDLPHRIETKFGAMAAVPNSDFTDNRVLKSSTVDLYDVHSTTFDYLHENEPMSLLALTLHCQFGGRPMVIAAFEKLIKYIAQHDDVWFTSHAELAKWAMEAETPDHTYRSRYFDSAA
ncbi:polysaccharide deacetylase family protein [Nitratireductor indicus]|uniref:polysaccharide deacetylase family protein n=1 Tax=Nitratireductor indicus TaxID=721133 RepID=UPI00287702B5|nr:polysaccharide deacetylase family protein [Nitratireductor indicus]MDS1138768.1 polysaccharide deacetylase family protein [Nitratireductor indicus]